jgi:hypothetical protein
VTDARGGARGSVEEGAGASIGGKRLAFHDANGGGHAAHIHLGRIDMLVVDEPREHVEGRAVLRIE